MLEKIKSVPFIDESEAVKVISIDGKIVLERNDRVIWASEKTGLEAHNISCYVEADKFFALLPEIKSLEQGNCLKVTLKNNAVYELPYLDVSWEPVEMPEEYSNTITFKLADLMLCTLNNLIKPELQCIWIDEHGAVSCDFVSACISKSVKASKGFLLPPDVQPLVDGRVCKVEVTDGRIYILASDFAIATSRPTEGDDKWYEQLRGMLDGASEFTQGESLAEGLKRLALFADYITFDGDKALAGSNFEPFIFKDLNGAQYEIEKVSRIMSTASSIGEKDGNLIFKNESSMFLVSPQEEA